MQEEDPLDFVDPADVYEHGDPGILTVLLEMSK